MALPPRRPGAAGCRQSDTGTAHRQSGPPDGQAARSSQSP